jgi:hypothetical protein
MLVHLEHGDLRLAEDRLELVVGQDLATILRVLQIMLLDVIPDPAHHLRPGQGSEPTTAANSLDGCSGFCRAGLAFLPSLVDEAPLVFRVWLGMPFLPRCVVPKCQTPSGQTWTQAAVFVVRWIAPILPERAILTPERAHPPYNIGCPPVTGTTAPDV